MLQTRELATVAVLPSPNLGIRSMSICKMYQLIGGIST